MRLSSDWRRCVDSSCVTLTFSPVGFSFINCSDLIVEVRKILPYDCVVLWSSAHGLFMIKQYKIDGLLPSAFPYSLPLKGLTDYHNSSLRKSASTADWSDLIQLLCHFAFHPAGGIWLHASDTYTFWWAVLLPLLFAPMTTLRIRSMAELGWSGFYFFNDEVPLNFRIVFGVYLFGPVMTPHSFRTKILTFLFCLWDSQIFCSSWPSISFPFTLVYHFF